MNQTQSIKLQKKRLESAEERRARLDKAKRGQERNGGWKWKNKKKMRLGTKALISSELK